LLLAHGTDDRDKEILAIIETGLDFLAKIAFGDLDVVFGGAIGGHEVEETIIDVDELVFLTTDVGDIHIVGGGADIFQLLSGKDIDGDKMDLGVTVLAGLRGRHVDDLAWAALDANMSVLAESRALHRESQGRAGAGLLKGLIVALIVGHF